jgi:hypothetical protein
MPAVRPRGIDGLRDGAQPWPAVVVGERLAGFSAPVFERHLRGRIVFG